MRGKNCDSDKLDSELDHIKKKRKAKKSAFQFSQKQIERIN